MTFDEYVRAVSETIATETGDERHRPAALPDGAVLWDPGRGRWARIEAGGLTGIRATLADARVAARGGWPSFPEDSSAEGARELGRRIVTYLGLSPRRDSHAAPPANAPRKTDQFSATN